MSLFLSVKAGGEESPGYFVDDETGTARLQAGDKGTDINVTGNKFDWQL